MPDESLSEHIRRNFFDAFGIPYNDPLRVSSNGAYENKFGSTADIVQLFTNVGVRLPRLTTTESRKLYDPLKNLSEASISQVAQHFSGQAPKAAEIVAFAKDMAALEKMQDWNDTGATTKLVNFFTSFGKNQETVTKAIKGLSKPATTDLLTDMRQLAQNTENVDTLRKSIQAWQEKDILSYETPDQMTPGKRSAYKALSESDDVRIRMRARHALLIADLKEQGKLKSDEVSEASKFLLGLHTHNDAADKLRSALVDDEGNWRSFIGGSSEDELRKMAWNPGGTKFKGITNSLKDFVTLFSYTKFHGFGPGLARQIFEKGLMNPASLAGIGVLGAALAGQGMSYGATAELANLASPGGGAAPITGILNVGQTPQEYLQTARILGTGAGRGTNTAPLNQLIAQVRNITGQDYSQLGATLEQLGYSQKAIQGVFQAIGVGAGQGTPGQAANMAQFMAETHANWTAAQFTQQTNALGQFAGGARMNDAAAGLINSPMNLVQFALINGRKASEYRKNPALLRADFAKAVGPGGFLGSIDPDWAAEIMNGLGIQGNGNDVDYMRDHLGDFAAAAKASVPTAPSQSDINYQNAIARLQNNSNEGPIARLRTLGWNIANPSVRQPIADHLLRGTPLSNPVVRDALGALSMGNPGGAAFTALEGWAALHVQDALNAIRGNTAANTTAAPIAAKASDQYRSQTNVPSPTPSSSG